jgi:hypothetical protein
MTRINSIITHKILFVSSYHQKFPLKIILQLLSINKKPFPFFFFNASSNMILSFSFKQLKKIPACSLQKAIKTINLK